MKLTELLSTIDEFSLVCIQKTGSGDPLYLRRAWDFSFREVHSYEVEKIYPEFFSAVKEYGITIIVRSRESTKQYS